MITRIIKNVFRFGGVDVRRHDKTFDKYALLYDRYKGYTMLPQQHFVLNLDLCNSFRQVPGDYVECGVWRGGMSAAIAEVLGEQRQLHLFDSFEGLPPAREIDGKAALAWQQNTTSPDYFDNCTADERFVKEAMTLARHENYCLYKGWFDKTLPGSIQRPIGILRLDGDWYDSTMACLDNLYPKVVAGGLIILDDYYAWDGCAKAVHDYLSKIQAPTRVFQWHNSIAYLIKRN
jgi:O-methyltransferase